MQADDDQQAQDEDDNYECESTRSHHLLKRIARWVAEQIAAERGLK